jgi:hypothetical protein
MKPSLLGNRGLLPLPRSPLSDYMRSMENRLAAVPRPKTEWVPGYWRRVPTALFGYPIEWVPGYWRREG